MTVFALLAFVLGLVCLPVTSLGGPKAFGAGLWVLVLWMVATFAAIGAAVVYADWRQTGRH
jgi:hypothetical protein